MLADDDRRRVQGMFGADDEQVRRDHAISHILAVLSKDVAEQVRFYGGTALARSYLPEGRLSEDVDLIAVGPRNDVAHKIETALSRGLAREFGRPSFAPALTATGSVRPSSMSLPSGPIIQIQLLPGDHYPRWPFRRIKLKQLYADVGPAALAVPTRPAFVAWKTAAFIDRAAPRDLWDLAALAHAGAFSAEAAALFRRHGPFGVLPRRRSLPHAPDQDRWEQELSHQTKLTLTAEAAFDVVVQAWAKLARRQ